MTAILSEDRRVQRHDRWHILRFPIAVLLLFAAGMKVNDVVAILAGEGLLSSRSLLFAAIGLESALAAYLIIGNLRWSWRLTVATFGFFAMVSGYAWLVGQNCNCITERIGPGWMLLLDIAVLMTAWWLRPINLPDSPMIHDAKPDVSAYGLRVSGILIPLIVSLATGFLFIAAAEWRERTITSNTGDQIDYLLADMLIGKRWPLDSRIDLGLKPLDTGNWMVLVVRRDCDHCRELLAKHFADPRLHREGERTAIFIAGTDRWPFQFDRVSLETADTTSIEWDNDEPFVASPALFLLRNGIVVEAAEGEETKLLCEKLRWIVP